MEHYIQRAGGHLPALQKVIKVDFRIIHNAFTRLNTDAADVSPGLLETVAKTLDEFFDRIHHKLYRHYRALPDKRAQDSYLALYQDSVLQLMGHLLQYTRPAALYSTSSGHTLVDQCCLHCYRLLDGLLHYTTTLADGHIDPALPVPRAARTLLQEMLLHDLDALQARLEVLQVSPFLVGIILTPFHDLRYATVMTLHTVSHLRAVKQALWLLASHDALPLADDNVVQLLIAHDFRSPAFTAYCQRVPPPMPRKQHPRVQDDHNDPANSHNNDSLEDPGNDFISRRPLRVLGAIIAAAFELNFIQWGRDLTQLAARVARLHTFSGPANAESIRRGYNDRDILTKALTLLSEIVTLLKKKLAELDENNR